MPIQPFAPERGLTESGEILVTEQSELRATTARKLLIPWAVDPEVSWIDYRCWVETELDAGLVRHRPLPQVQTPTDTLASVFFSDRGNDADYGTKKGGVNVASFNRSSDVIQRMSTSDYRFTLRGYGLRVGYQIPIPGLRSVGAAPAYPMGRQWGYNVICGNLAGIPLWFATWELHYVCAAPFGPSAKAPVPPNPALAIRPDAQLPVAVMLPVPPLDSRASTSGQSILQGGAIR